MIFYPPQLRPITEIVERNHGNMTYASALRHLRPSATPARRVSSNQHASQLHPRYFMVFRSPNSVSPKLEQNSQETTLLGFWRCFIHILICLIHIAHVDFRNGNTFSWWMAKQIVCPNLFLVQIFLAWHTSEIKCHGGWCLCHFFRYIMVGYMFVMVVYQALLHIPAVEADYSRSFRQNHCLLKTPLPTWSPLTRFERRCYVCLQIVPILITEQIH